MSTHPDDPDAMYLPPSYRHQVKKKKQRRTYKKLATAGILLVVVIVLYLIISSMLAGPLPPASSNNSHTPAPTIVEQAPAPEMNVTAAVTPGFATGSGISVLHSPDILTLNDAIAFIRQDYSGDAYTLISANLTDRYPGHWLYEFTIRSSASSHGSVITVFVDAVNGDPFTPGQENSRITPMQAQDLVRKTFPEIQPDQVRVRYNDTSDAGRQWIFTLIKGSRPVLAGTLDAETGLISSFSHAIQKLGRPVEPVFDLPASQKIAENYISGQNGPVGVNITKGQYVSLGIPSDPVAGQYVFRFSRIVNDIPCDEDGFIVGVDAVSGEISAYERRWSAPDNAFSAASEPFILRREATFTVLQRAGEMYPESVNGLRILSANILWKDKHPYGVTPRPGGIPLAWKVEFDDSFMQANRSVTPAVGWVDAQTGRILEFDYRH